MSIGIDQEHPRYKDRKAFWKKYWDFYVGGEQIRRNASLYLVRRQKEPNDVYSERISRVFYENYLGSCIDWYAATLFRSRPTLTFDTRDDATRSFYSCFVEDCDLEGSALSQLAKKAFIDTMVFGESYVLLDFPKIDASVRNRAEEDALGKSRAYLASYSPIEVINWKADRGGAFEWVVIRTEHTFQDSLDDPETITERRWTVFDREEYRLYRSTGKSGESKPDGVVELIARGRHALADHQRVPIVRMSVSEGLWLANKAALLQQEHFDKSNALSWALHMGLFAMPVVYSEREWQQIVGEAYYLQLGPDDRFGWTEPEGKVFQIAADNLDRLKDEIYRVCFLMTQAGGREARNLGQSGESKRRDFAVTHEVLRSYGDTVKDFLRDILRLAAAARRDSVVIGVSGMDSFDNPEFHDEVAAAVGMRDLGIESPTLNREIQRRVALKYLESASQETKLAVLREIG